MIVESNNIQKEPFLNLENVLKNNTAGIFVSSTSTSKEVPVIIVTPSVRQSSADLSGNKSFLITVDFNCIHKDVLKSADLGTEVMTLLEDNKESLAALNMNMQNDAIFNTSVIKRGTSFLFNNIITLQFHVS